MTEPNKDAPEATSPTDTADATSKSSYTNMASSAAGTATETATNAAVGVKDTMFSMFGGGGKRESKDEKGTEEEDRSGSAKVQKEKEKEKEKPGEEAKEGDNGEDGVSLRSHPLSSNMLQMMRIHQPMKSDAELERMLRADNKTD